MTRRWIPFLLTGAGVLFLAGCEPQDPEPVVDPVVDPAEPDTTTPGYVPPADDPAAEVVPAEPQGTAPPPIDGGFGTTPDTPTDPVEPFDPTTPDPTPNPVPGDANDAPDAISEDAPADEPLLQPDDSD